MDIRSLNSRLFNKSNADQAPAVQFPGSARINIKATSDNKDAVTTLLTLSKRRDISESKYQEALEEVNKTVDKERPFSQAETILQKAGDLVKRLRKLAEMKEDSLLTSKQVEAIGKDQDKIYEEIDLLRGNTAGNPSQDPPSKGEFQNLSKLTDEALAAVQSGNGKDFIAKYGSQSEFLGDGFVALVANGDAKGLQTVKTGVDALANFDFTKATSSKALGELEKKINDALTTLRSAPKASPTAAGDNEKTASAQSGITPENAGKSADQIGLQILKSDTDELKNTHDLDSERVKDLTL